jgi:serine/threonine protein kinase
MKPDGEPNAPDAVRSVIQTQHPGIAGEIDSAIKTLRKLQKIAGSPEPAAGAGPAEPSAGATTDGAPPPAEDGASSGLHTEVGAAPAEGRTPPTLSAGDTFGRYQIVRRLGQGAMGAVYLAFDCQLQRHVALKTPFLSGGSQTVERFFREARAAAQIRSPYVCPIHDVGEIGGVYYLSMAYIDGRTLSRAIAGGLLGDARAVAALTQKIARGMQKAHEQGIVHRDLKPDNIMIDGDGEPIVMDFGLARRVDGDVRLTLPGRIIGTPAYMSPEQVDGDPKGIGPPTDVYSLGVVFYEMLTGRTPFQGSFTSVLRQIASGEPPRPSSINPALGADSPAERVCLRMMARSPANRCPSMAAVVEALEEAFPRERPPDAAPSAWARLFAWATGLFKRRTRARPAGPPGSSPDRTHATSGSGPPPKQERRSDEKTIDLPRPAGARPAGPPGSSADRTLASSGSGPQQKQERRSDEQTIDVPRPNGA